MLGHGVGDGRWVTFQAQLKALLEHAADAVSGGNADVVVTGGHDDGALERAVLVEDVPDTCVADGGDFGYALGLYPDAPRTEESSDARFDHVVRVRIGRRPEVRQQERSAEPILVLDLLEDAHGHRAATRRARSGRCRVRGCPRLSRRNFGEGPESSASSNTISSEGCTWLASKCGKRSGRISSPRRAEPSRTRRHGRVG